jgi:hypothetical protein
MFTNNIDMECIHMDAALTPPKAGHSKRAKMNSALT